MSQEKIKNSAPIVVFGEDWNSHPSSTQHLFVRLMENYPVIWVNSIGLRRPRLSFRDIKRLADKALNLVMRTSRAPSKASALGNQPISIIQPLAVPFHGNALADWINGKLLSWQVRRKLSRLNLKSPLLWISLPSAVGVVGKCGEVATIYYAGDDFSALSGVDHKPITRMESRLADKADAIIAASPTIAQRFPRDKSFIIPHGCDHQLFSKPCKPATDADWSKPVAGFYGSLDRWLDEDLLLGLAQSLPDWNFQLIGPIKTDLHRLMKQRNIHHLGVKDHAKLPSYAQHWTVGLIPFRDNEQIRACNPLKLREYLACGIPVVSTRFPAVLDYQDVVSICDDQDGFRQALLKNLQQDHQRQKQRRDRVFNESWEARARDIGVLIEVLQNATAVQNDMTVNSNEIFNPLISMN